MRTLTLLMLPLFLAAGCRKPLANGMTEQYRLAGKNEKKSPDQYWDKSKSWITVDTETGDFKGSFRGAHFSGNYIIKRVSSGFSKGFIYQVELGFLEKPADLSASAEDFFRQLSEGRKLYFYPDKLHAPEWVFLEISSPGNPDPVKFILKKLDKSA